MGQQQSQWTGIEINGKKIFCHHRHSYYRMFEQPECRSYDVTIDVKQMHMCDLLNAEFGSSCEFVVEHNGKIIPTPPENINGKLIW